MKLPPMNRYCLDVWQQLSNTWDIIPNPATWDCFSRDTWDHSLSYKAFHLKGVVPSFCDPHFQRSIIRYLIYKSTWLWHFLPDPYEQSACTFPSPAKESAFLPRGLSVRNRHVQIGVVKLCAAEAANKTTKRHSNKGVAWCSACFLPRKFTFVHWGFLPCR